MKPETVIADYIIRSLSLRSSDPEVEVAIISLIGSHQSKCLFQFHPVEDRIHHAGMDGFLRNCAGCRVDEAFTMDDLVDSISADTSGLRCNHVQLRIAFITPVWTVC
ncbi:hypothetical protein DPX16_10725 [Anabarilius grahami]|uniref:Uncharacterized protein n=1 Tax=Anabarilius grahami TaxID=495550 RepID=A0A3N0Z7N1_ANAGA|nr:hypothetical protein DPX16_10725 [Anabarilius grahami]